MSFRILGACALSLFAAAAHASSFVATTDTLGVSIANSVELSTDASFSLSDQKRLLAAREDAASFVASNGALRGARLESALQLLRSRLPADTRSDLQLAEALLAR